MVLLGAASCGHATVVVDLTRTRFCDSAGLSVLAGAHRRALAEGGELRLVLPAGGAVARVVRWTGLDRFIRCFTSLDQALMPGPATSIPPWRSRLSPGPRGGAPQPGRPAAAG